MSLLSGIVGAVEGFITGGPAGAVVGAVAGYAAGGGSPSAPRPTPMPAPGFGPFTIGGGATIGPTGVNVGYGANWGSPGTSVTAPAGGTCPPGFHLNKHALAPTKRHGAVPARSMCVRNRHLNPLNPRALTHALKREKRARKLIGRLHVYKPVQRVAARSGHRAGCRCAVCRR